MSILNTYLTAIAGGILYALGNIGFGFWPAAFVCLIPLWWAIDNKSDTSSFTHFKLGLCFGLAIYISGYAWLIELGKQFINNAEISFLLWLFTGFVFALGFGAYAYLYRKLHSLKLNACLSALAPLLLLEWLQPNLFPAYLGGGLIHRPELAQLASIGGPALLSTLVVIINCLIYWGFSHRHRLSAAHALLISTLCIMIIYDWGSFRIETITKQNDLTPSADKMTVGLIQNNVVGSDKRSLARQSHQANLDMSQTLLQKTAVDLMIWPESAYVHPLRRPLPLDAQLIRRDIASPLLFGGTSIWHKNGQSVSSNSVFFANDKGKIEQAYDKQKLIPFSETVPFMTTIKTFSQMEVMQAFFPDLLEDYQSWLEKIFPMHQQFINGHYSDVITFDKFTMATPICYELIHPGYIQSQIKQGHANIIVTLANDAWFGHTQEPAIHLALAQQRAIEHRVWVIRATNSGYSAVIDPTGRIVTQSELFKAQTLTAEVHPSTRASIFTQWGNWLTHAVLLWSLVLMIYVRSRLVISIKLNTLPQR